MSLVIRTNPYQLDITLVSASVDHGDKRTVSYVDKDDGNDETIADNQKRAQEKLKEQLKKHIKGQ